MRGDDYKMAGGKSSFTQGYKKGEWKKLSCTERGREHNKFWGSFNVGPLKF